MKGNVMITEAQALRLAATATFRPFDSFDWSNWAGCTTHDPLICETDKYVLILDGSSLSYVTYPFGDPEEQTFMLEQMGE